MRVVVQRVREASVSVDETRVGEIRRGLCLLVGFGREDSTAVLEPMARKIVNLRVFSDESGRFQHSCLEIGGGILAVPQFTLYGDTSKGRRPEFFSALAPEQATQLFDGFKEALQNAGISRVAAGVFGARMMVEIKNDGPVTILLEL